MTTQSYLYEQGDLMQVPPAIPFGISLFAMLGSEQLSKQEAKLLYENLWDLYCRSGKANEA